MNNRKVFGGLVFGAMVLCASRVTPAHHSQVMFDGSRDVQVSGIVRTFEWGNPHVWLWVTVLDAKGSSTNYAFEGTSPGEMTRRNGWTRNTVSTADKVTVKYHPFKNGNNGGRLEAVTLADGRVLHVEGGLPPSKTRSAQ